MNAKTHEAIVKHGKSLLAAFPNATEKDPVALCKKLRRIETSLAKPLTDYCNGDLQDDNEGTILDGVCDKAIARAMVLLINFNPRKSLIRCEQTEIFHVNRDPRGYALKLDDVWTREYNRNATQRIYTDMGGYGILAPDLNQ